MGEKSKKNVIIILFVVIAVASISYYMYCRVEEERIAKENIRKNQEHVEKLRHDLSVFYNHVISGGNGEFSGISGLNYKESFTNLTKLKNILANIDQEISQKKSEVEVLQEEITRTVIVSQIDIAYFVNENTAITFGGIKINFVIPPAYDLNLKNFKTAEYWVLSSQNKNKTVWQAIMPVHGIDAAMQVNKDTENAKKEQRKKISLLTEKIESLNYDYKNTVAKIRYDYLAEYDKLLNAHEKLFNMITEKSGVKIENLDVKISNLVDAVLVEKNYPPIEESRLLSKYLHDLTKTSRIIAPTDDSSLEKERYGETNSKPNSDLDGDTEPAGLTLKNGEASPIEGLSESFSGEEQEICRTIERYYTYVQNKDVNSAIKMYSSRKQESINAKLIKNVSEDTEYYKFKNINIKINEADSDLASANLMLSHKKYRRPEEIWDVNVSLIKEDGEWRIMSTPGRRI